MNNKNNNKMYSLCTIPVDCSNTKLSLKQEFDSNITYNVVMKFEMKSVTYLRKYTPSLVLERNPLYWIPYLRLNNK